MTPAYFRSPAAAATQSIRFRNVTAVLREVDSVYTLSDILDGTLIRAIDFSFDGHAYARVKGLTIDAGFISFDQAKDAELAIVIPDLRDLSKVEVRTAIPAEGVSTDIQHILDNDAGLIVVVPDFREFRFKNLTFQVIIEAVQVGIDFLQDSLQDKPFYEEALPIVNQSLSDMLSFVDELSERLQTAALDPVLSIQEVESVLEEAFGINEDNTLPVHEQSFGLELNGEVLDIHIHWEALFKDTFGFSLDLSELGVNFEGIEVLTDIAGVDAGGQIELEAYVDLTIDIGIDFSNLQSQGGSVCHIPLRCRPKDQSWNRARARSKSCRV